LLVTAPEQTDPTIPTARPTTPSASSDASRGAARGGVLVLGEAGGLGAALLRRLQGNGTAAGSALGLTDSEVTELLLEGEWAATAVVARDDALALRLTLLSAHVRPELPLWVTMFDRTVAHKLDQVASRVHVFSPSEIVAEDLARSLEEAGAVPRHRTGVRLVDEALRLLIAAGAGLAVALAVEVVLTMIAFEDGFANALYFSTRTVATVAGPPSAEHAPTWFKLLSAANMVVAIVLVAVFTAALVRRLSRRRLTTVFGPRAAPRSHHVLVVGFGQVGFRLAQLLRERGVPAIGVERDPEAPQVRLAGGAGIPVALGRGDDREVLSRLGVDSCAALAVVTSDDLVNVAVGLAASDLRPGLPIVLRLGDGEVASETDSLLHLGQICDAHKLAAVALAEAIETGT
jgi:Trk K+ transport system NAD-binding subunit